MNFRFTGLLGQGLMWLTCKCSTLQRFLLGSSGVGGTLGYWGSLNFAERDYFVS